MAKKCDIKIVGVANIWPKGQIVIPKEIRVELNLETWDALTVLLSEWKYIGLVKNNDLESLTEYMDSIHN